MLSSYSCDCEWQASASRLIDYDRASSEEELEIVSTESLISGTEQPF